MSTPIERDGRIIPEQIIIPAERSKGYQNWVKDGAYLLKENLPFSPPADVSITIGSGLTAVVDYLQLEDKKIIPFQDLGLPVGQVEGHRREIIAGTTLKGKKVILVNGRTHAYEIPLEGMDTANYGKLSRMELATGYLAMLDEIGVGNVILTCAAGGIAHPLYVRDIQPFFPESLPVIGIIANDINLAYESPHMGPYQGYGRGERFIPLVDADPSLMALFSQSMINSGDVKPPLLYYATGPTTPSFEDTAAIYDLAIRGVQVVGMSYSYEKQFLSGAKKIRRFMGVAVVTNSHQLTEREDQSSGNPHVLSVEELRYRYPGGLIPAHLASHEEVLQMGLRANERLGKALALTVNNLPSLAP